MDDNNRPADKEAPAVDLKEIRQIVDLMTKNGLTFFHMEREGVKLKLRRGGDFEAVKDLLSHLPAAMPQPIAMAAPQMAMPVQAAVPVSTSGPAQDAPSTAASEPSGPTINSPMVGTFYRSPAPGEKSFVNIGDQVDENTTVCIIEAMKVMNEIKAEVRGTVVRVLAEDGKPVQYGQPLFELKA